MFLAFGFYSIWIEAIKYLMEMEDKQRISYELVPTALTFRLQRWKLWDTTSAYSIPRVLAMFPVLNTKMRPPAQTATSIFNFLIDSSNGQLC